MDRDTQKDGQHTNKCCPTVYLGGTVVVSGRIGGMDDGKELVKDKTRSKIHPLRGCGL